MQCAKPWRRRPRRCGNIDWVELTDVRGHVQNGEIAHFQATVKVGFRLE